MKITRALVPSLFTVLNLFSGFSSIVYASQGDLHTAAWFIIVAAACDALDGIMARLTKSSSEFGTQFDSLADMVSFGAAPGLLAFRAFLYQFNGLGVLLSSLVMIFGGIRLARFNVQLVGFDKDFFRGLPIPVSAMLISSFVLSYYSDLAGLTTTAGFFLAALMLVVSALMVSRLKYDTLPKFTRRDIRKHSLRFSLFLAAAGVILGSGGSQLFAVFVAYAATGLLRALVTAIRHAVHPEEREAAEEQELSSMDL